MNEIKANIVARSFYALIPIFMCIGLFCIAGTFVWMGIWGVIEGEHLGFLYIFFGSFPLILTILLTKPLWYRFFFDRSYLNFACITRVQWDEDRVHFYGAYCDLEVSAKDVISYLLPFGFSPNSDMCGFIIKIQVGSAIHNVTIPGLMTDKILFLNFLEKLEIRCNNRL